MTATVPPSLVIKRAADAGFVQVVVIGVKEDGSIQIIQSAESRELMKQVAKAIVEATPK